MKGSPEKIRALCLEDSFPDDFESVLNEYTCQGFRVLAFAHKKLNADVTREEAVKLP